MDWYPLRYFIKFKLGHMLHEQMLRRQMLHGQMLTGQMFQKQLTAYTDGLIEFG